MPAADDSPEQDATPQGPPRKSRVYVVSDGTGGTAQRALSAALTQFRQALVEVEVHREVDSRDKVHQVVSEANRHRALIVHTLVSNELRRTMQDDARLHNVEAVDLLGPLLERLSEELAISPAETPGLFRQINEAYFRRIEAGEFAFKHDDGNRIEELGQAEIVLVGVSRTFKTPLSVYLAYRGWLTANVPIILEIPPPPALFELPPCVVFGLKMETKRLAALRNLRAVYLKHSVGDYADLQRVRRECTYALRQFARRPDWPVIDVGGKPIEEIASEIIAIKRSGCLGTNG